MSLNPPLVVHIIDELPPDGAERLLVDVLKHRSSEFDFMVLCLVSGGDLQHELRDMGIPVSVIGKQRKFDLKMFLKLVLWLLDHKPDVVHTHLFTADTWGRLAAALARVPCIFSTVHSTNGWKKRLHRSVDSVLARLSTKLIACSAEVAKVLVERDRITPTRIVTIPNGISLARFVGVNAVNLNTEFRISPTTVSIAMVGRLHPAKGHLDILPVMEQFQRDNIGCHLIIIGDGELRADIEKNIRNRKIDQMVTLTGQRNDVPRILSAVDILVMPSRWEGLPIALLEGMALGKAVLATTVGGIPDVIQDNCNGLLVAAGDSDAMHERLQTLISDKQLRLRLGKAASSAVQVRFSAASVAAQYEALYRDSLNLQRARLEGDISI